MLEDRRGLLPENFPGEHPALSVSSARDYLKTTFSEQKPLIITRSQTLQGKRDTEEFVQGVGMGSDWVGGAIGK